MLELPLDVKDELERAIRSLNSKFIKDFQSPSDSEQDEFLKLFGRLEKLATSNNYESVINFLEILSQKDLILCHCFLFMLYFKYDWQDRTKARKQLDLVNEKFSREFGHVLFEQVAIPEEIFDEKSSREEL